MQIPFITTFIGNIIIILIFLLILYISFVCKFSFSIKDLKINNNTNQKEDKKSYYEHWYYGCLPYYQHTCKFSKEALAVAENLVYQAINRKRWILSNILSFSCLEKIRVKTILHCETHNINWRCDYDT